MSSKGSRSSCLLKGDSIRRKTGNEEENEESSQRSSDRLLVFFGWHWDASEALCVAGI